MTKFRQYALKRLLNAITVILAAIVLNFVIFRALPGDSVSNLSRVPGISPEYREALSRQFGLDSPLGEQFVLYLKQLAQGNLGVSFANQQPVLQNLQQALANTIPMVALGLLIALVAGTIGGVLSARRPNGLFDRVSLKTAMVMWALPSQWVALIAVIWVASALGLPSGGREDPFLVDPSTFESLVDLGRHMILPSSVLALSAVGIFFVSVRSSMVEVLREDYLVIARAKGLSPSRILWRHAFRNAMMPLVTVTALLLGGIVGGAVLTETVFSWPGIGREIYESVTRRDFPMMQGAFLVVTTAVVLLNYVAELVQFRVDPRVRA